MRHAMKHVVPNTIPGTPGWHYKALHDLLTMVEANGCCICSGPSWWTRWVRSGRAAQMNRECTILHHPLNLRC